MGPRPGRDRDRGGGRGTQDRVPSRVPLRGMEDRLPGAGRRRLLPAPGRAGRAAPALLLTQGNTTEGGSPMIRGRKVGLRAIEREDIPRLWELRNDAKVEALSYGPPRPHSKVEMEAWFEKLTAERDD